VTHNATWLARIARRRSRTFSARNWGRGHDSIAAKDSKESDRFVITGGEPTLRGDIEQIVQAARFDCKFRSVLLISNGTLAGPQAESWPE